MAHPNANMATSSQDRYGGSYLVDPAAGFSGPVTQSYNNFRVQTLGGNIIQGQVNNISVAEIMFPYDIPTVIAGKNDTFNVTLYTQTVDRGLVVSDLLEIKLPPAFYTASEMAAALQTAINAATATQGWANNTITVTVDPQNLSLVVKNTTTYSSTPGDTNYFFSWSPTPSIAAPYGSNTSVSLPSLAQTAGFKNYFIQYPITYNSSLVKVIFPAVVPLGYVNVGTAEGVPVFPGAATAVLGAPYSGRYTDWIDLCSPTLCQAQYVRDGNTNQTTTNRDIICRLYIANEISTYQADNTGTRPFVIHRQFKNAKVMKWTVDRSIDSIDIRMIDMYGQAVQLSGANIVTLAPSAQVNSGYRDFAITFLVQEPGAEVQNENIGYRY